MITNYTYKNHKIIAIDGKSASFKTTTAVKLAERLQGEGISAAVVHCDDFFLPKELRTEERFMQPGGNIHYERLKKEVLDSIAAGRETIYRPFDCSTMDLGTPVTIPMSQVYIVEGAYALHPYFGTYYDLAVFMKASPDKQLPRIEKRGGNLQMFRERWIPMENRYHEVCGIEVRADIVLDTSQEEADTVSILYDRIEGKISVRSEAQ